MKKLIYILIGFILGIGSIYFFKYLNSNGTIIPIKNSYKYPLHENIDFNVIVFRDFSIALPNEWEDKGYEVGIEGEIYGELASPDFIINYEYGPTARPGTETLEEYLYQFRNSDMLMADTHVFDRKPDSSYSVSYSWPVDCRTSDTVKTGIITDSIRNAHPELWSRRYFFGEPNYFSLTKYNDSVYLVPIEVPSEIVNSRISNRENNNYSYNILRPKDFKTGYTKIVIHYSNYFPVVMHCGDIDSMRQNILIDAGLSLRFKH